MASSTDNRTKPLWLIAFSLVAIATCLVLLVIKSLLEEPRETPHSTPPAATNRNTTPNPFFAKRSNSATNRPAGIKNADAAMPTPSSGGQRASSRDVTLVSYADSTPTAGGGVIAPLAALEITNGIAAIVGRVTLRGTPPAEVPIDTRAFPPCARGQTNVLTTHNFVVGEDSGLADVFVSIVRGLKEKNSGDAPTIHELTFANCEIRPYVSAVTAGQRVAFANSDRTTHAVRLMPTNNAAATFSLAPAHTNRTVRWSRPEDLLQIRCDVHPWESAYVSVVEHPFFAVTDTNGDFVIPNVPAGKYTVRARHRKAQGTNDLAREVTVRSGEISVVNFTLAAPESPIRPLSRYSENAR